VATRFSDNSSFSSFQRKSSPPQGLPWKSASKRINRPKGHSGRGRHRLGKQAGSLDRARRRRQAYSATFLHPANRLKGWSQKLDHWGGFRPSRWQLDSLGQGAMWGAGLGGRVLYICPLEMSTVRKHRARGHHGLPGVLWARAGWPSLAKPRAVRWALPDGLRGRDGPCSPSLGCWARNLPWLSVAIFILRRAAALFLHNCRWGVPTAIWHCVPPDAHIGQPGR